MMRCRVTFISIFLLLLANAPSTLACATCFGASDSPMAQGMNWGIFSLLVVITFMLSCIAGFFVFLAKRSAQLAASPEQLPTKNV